MTIRTSQTSTEYLTPQQAAKIIGCSVRSLYRWEDDGLINPRRTPGGHRRYTHADIDQLLQRRTA